MATIASGTLTLEDGGVTATPGARLTATGDDSVMSYSIIQVDAVMQPRKDANGWEHYSYLFTYRLPGGRRLTVTWRGGTFWTAQEVAKPEHAASALESAFRDAASVEHDSLQGWAADMGYELGDPDDYRRAVRTYDACERMSERLSAFLGAARGAWAEATQEV